MSSPRISVVIPLYNKATLVERTLRSVLSQTFKDYEIIVVDDGSTDGSAELVESLNLQNLQLIRQENSGVSAARNRGIKEAKGEFIALLDADDEWKPDYLSTQFALTQKYSVCDVFSTDYVFCKADEKTESTVIRKIAFEGEDGELSNYFEAASISNPPLWTSAIMFRKSAIEAVGYFPVGLKSGEDLLTWARMAARFRIAYSRKPLAIFNVEGYDVREKPKRIPAENDIVGEELKKLEEEFNPPYIRQYRSMWHKMRASVYMRLRMRRKSIRETAKALRLNPKNYKLYAFLLLNLLPSRLQPF